MPDPIDSHLICAQCGGTFQFDANERERFEARGFVPPKRCPECRHDSRRQASRPASGETAAAAAPPPARPRRERPPAELHEATCSLCGIDTQVPFVPDGVRPIFCLPCLKQRTR